MFIDYVTVLYYTGFKSTRSFLLYYHHVDDFFLIF